MIEILTRAGCFVGIIILGNVLRRVGVFKEEDFGVISKILLKITLPAAIVSSFLGKEIEWSLILLPVLGLGIGAVYMLIAYICNIKSDKKKQAFEMVNLSGGNIGAFTMPFVQSFLGPVGVITTSLFDVGNAFISLGGSYGIGATVQDNQKFSVKRLAKVLFTSVAFDCYLIMTVVCILHIPIPTFISEFANLAGSANAFVAMLMIGVGFKITGDKQLIGRVIRMLSIRYGVAVLFAVGCFFLLPFSLEVRQALMILAFSPLPSSAPAYTRELDGDVGLSSALNSISIVCSIIFIVSILTFIL